MVMVCVRGGVTYRGLEASRRPSERRRRQARRAAGWMKRGLISWRLEDGRHSNAR